MKCKFNNWKFFRNEKGTAMAEFAIILPLLLSFIMISYEFGRAYYIQNALEYAAKEAGKTGSSIKASGTSITKSTLDSLIKNSVMIG